MRLSKVVANIVSDDQTCGVPGRTILNNVFILRDLVVICKQKNIPAAITSIDQMKAFVESIGPSCIKHCEHSGSKTILSSRSNSCTMEPKA